MRIENKISSKKFLDSCSMGYWPALKFISDGFKEIEGKNEVVEKMVVNREVQSSLVLLEHKGDTPYGEGWFWTAKVKIEDVEDIILYSRDIDPYEDVIEMGGR